MYACSTTIYQGFQVSITQQEAEKFKGRCQLLTVGQKRPLGSKQTPFKTNYRRAKCFPSIKHIYITFVSAPSVKRNHKSVFFAF